VGNTAGLPPDNKKAYFREKNKLKVNIELANLNSHHRKQKVIKVEMQPSPEEGNKMPYTVKKGRAGHAK
jgi:hypothetical protein